MKNNNSSETKTIIINIASQISEIPIEKIKDNSKSIYQLGFDSLMIIDLKNQLEKEFDLEGKLELKNIINLNTIDDFVEHINFLSNSRT